MVDISDLVLDVRENPSQPGTYVGTNFYKTPEGEYVKSTVLVERRDLVRVAVLKDQKGGPVYLRKGGASHGG